MQNHSKLPTVSTTVGVGIPDIFFDIFEHDGWSRGVFSRIFSNVQRCRHVTIVWTGTSILAAGTQILQWDYRVYGSFSFLVLLWTDVYFRWVRVDQTGCARRRLRAAAAYQPPVSCLSLRSCLSAACAAALRRELKTLL